jgi:hypothetical protein
LFSKRVDEFVLRYWLDMLTITAIFRGAEPTMKRAILNAALVTSVLVAPAAHADPQQDYLHELAQAGASYHPPSWLLHLAEIVCIDLRHGMTPDDVATRDFVHTRPQAPVIIAAAQHHICPETLGNGG